MLIIGALTLLLGVILVLSNHKQPTSGSRTSCKTHHDTYNVKKMTIDSKNLNVLVADSPAKWEYGLMNVKSKKDICGHDGMVFTFPIALPQTFWNKDTLVDLDMYWMRGDEKVGQDILPAITKSGIKTVSSPEPVDRVVEVLR